MRVDAARCDICYLERPLKEIPRHEILPSLTPFQHRAEGLRLRLPDEVLKTMNVIKKGKFNRSSSTYNIELFQIGFEDDTISFMPTSLRDNFT